VSQGTTPEGVPAGVYAPKARHSRKAGYGVDDPRTIAELAIAGVLAVVVGFLISYYTASSNSRLAGTALLVGPSVGFLILAVTAALYWSSRLGKPREMGKLVNSIPWGGEEVVLDLGCGRGLASILAAKKLETGFTVGVDVFSKARISGNDPTSVLANAYQDKVDSKVSAVKAAAVELPIADRSIDVIVSAVAFHHLAPRRQREALFVEMNRVLKDGGRVGILDAGNGNEYSSLLRGLGLTDVQMHRLRFSSFPPFHVVVGRKPYSE